MGTLTEGIIDSLCRVLECPDVDVQPNVEPIKQAANIDHSQWPTVCALELSADSMRKEATLDLPKLSENDEFEGTSNPDNEPTPSQEILKPDMVMTSPCCISPMLSSQRQRSARMKISAPMKLRKKEILVILETMIYPFSEDEGKIFIS